MVSHSDKLAGSGGRIGYYGGVCWPGPSRSASSRPDYSDRLQAPGHGPSLARGAATHL